MRSRLAGATLASLGAVIAALACSPAALASSSAARVVLQHASPAARPADAVGSTPASTQIEFDVALKLSNPSGAATLEQAVSDPSSPSYRHYLTPAEWESRYSPTRASVEAVSSWLRSQGITVTGVTPDRMTVHASATASTVERAFDTSLGEYRHAHSVVRLAASALTVPADVAPEISAVSGVDEHLATPTGLTGAESLRARPDSGKPISQPPGTRTATPCSSYYGQLYDTTDPAFGDGFPDPLPYAVCGYTPTQFQGAYGLAPKIARGIDGKGVTVAIIDAYASPSILGDAQEYAARNQSPQPLETAQFNQDVSPKFNQVKTCEANGWFGEETLDVEAVHATAPGANILYVGAKNCSTTALYRAVQSVVDGHLAQIITDSWGEDGGDILEAQGTREAFDDILLMAGGTGIGVQFSAGDEGDEFSTLGRTLADYPASSPYATSVGGTSLQINKRNRRIGEVGWSTSKSVLCTPTLERAEYPGCTPSLLNTWLPPAPGKYDYGGGGGTSLSYPEPWYQVGVVPAALAERNTAVTGIANRVEPDIAMDADPTTGMLVGETQEFPDGTYYGEYRIGGTSVASPLFAGVMADADQAAGVPLGFANPVLYKLDSSSKTAARAFYDVVPAAPQALARVDYLNGLNAEEGTLTSVRVLDYEGEEAYCEEEGETSCPEQPVSISTAPGFDSMTGIGTPGPALVTLLAKP
jgi:subtilase family serine protease